MLPFIYVFATKIKPGDLPRGATDSNEVRAILSIVFGIVGAVSLLIIVVSGLRYVISSGDPGRISKAKNGIIYSLLGLLIAISAEAIIAFVVNRV